MKKLLVQILLFALPVLLLVYFLPVNVRRQFEGLKNDCEGRGIWVYNRMVSKVPLDVAFIGSSHTINGINDSLLTRLTKKYAVNFGYCRLGRNLQYVLVKRLLSNQRVKTLVLEIDRRENLGGHPIFPFVANSQEVVFGDFYFNRGYFTDLWLHANYKLELIQDEFYRNDTLSQLYTNFGIMSHPIPADSIFLRKVQHERIIQPMQGNFFDEHVRKHLAMDYVQRISDLCREKKVKLIFLYLPGFGEPAEASLQKEKYRKWGEVLFPPNSLLSDPLNWHDEDHLDQRGSEKLSKWLAEKLP